MSNEINDDDVEFLSEEAQLVSPVDAAIAIKIWQVCTDRIAYTLFALIDLRVLLTLIFHGAFIIVAPGSDFSTSFFTPYMYVTLILQFISEQWLTFLPTTRYVLWAATESSGGIRIATLDDGRKVVTSEHAYTYVHIRWYAFTLALFYIVFFISDAGAIVAILFFPTLSTALSATLSTLTSGQKAWAFAIVIGYVIYLLFFAIGSFYTYREVRNLSNNGAGVGHKKVKLLARGAFLRHLWNRILKRRRNRPLIFI